MLHILLLLLHMLLLLLQYLIVTATYLTVTATISYWYCYISDWYCYISYCYCLVLLLRNETVIINCEAWKLMDLINIKHQMFTSAVFKKQNEKLYNYKLYLQQLINLNMFNYLLVWRTRAGKWWMWLAWWFCKQTNFNNAGGTVDST